MTSLNHSNNLCFVTLDCPTISSSGKGDSYCKSQEDEIKEAKEAVEKCKNDSEQKSKKEKELKKLQSGLDEHIAKDHSLDESTRSNKIEEVKKQKEFVKKFGEDFNTALNGSDNILTHLCDGLQTFLGYDKDSKGYDGNGIVYSDLDRLCDAVMGFLSGVLGAVKNDPSVKTYYSKQHMTSTIDCLKNSMHKGPSEYHSALVAAAQALELWNGELEKRTDAFLNTLSELQTNNITNLTSSLHFLNNCSLDKVAEHLQTCIVDSVRLANELVAAKDAYSRLDPHLRIKLHDTVSNVDAAVERFVAAASNHELHELLKFSRHQLRKLTYVLKEHIEVKIKYLTNALNINMLALGKNIHEVGESLLRRITDLDRWISSAGWSIQNALLHVEDILKEVDDEKNPTNKNNLKNCSKELWQQSEALYSAGVDARLRVKQEVEKAKALIDPLEDVYKQKLWKVKTEVQRAVKKIKTEIGKLHGIIENGVAGKETGTITNLITEIQKNVAQIKGTSISIPMGLEGIKEKVKMYATKFTTKLKEDIVAGWVAEILGNKPVKGWIDTYVTENRSHIVDNKYKTPSKNGMNADLAKKIATEITAQLSAVFEKMTITPIGSDDSIDKNVKGMKARCENFVQQLELFIDGKQGVQHIAKEIAPKVNIKLQKDVFSNARTSNESYLQHAIELTLYQLIAVAKQVGNEIGSFLLQPDEDNVANEIDRTYTKTDGLARRLNEAIGKSSLRKNFAKEIDTAIEQVLMEPFEDIIETGDAKFITDPGYRKGPYENLAGAIGVIKSHVTDALRNIGAVKDSSLQHFRGVQRHLASMCTAIINATNDKSGLQKLLTEFKVHSIELKLTEITNKLRNLQKKDIEGLMNKTREIMQFADEQSKMIIKNLQSYVSEEVNRVTEEIQRESRTQYYLKISKMVDDMKITVNHNISVIRYIIDEDARTGVKGLIRTYKGVSINLKRGELPKFDSAATLLEPLNRNRRLAEFRDLSSTCRTYFMNILRYVEHQTNQPPTAPTKSPPTDPAKQLTKIKEHFDELLGHLKNNTTKKYNYDNKFVSLLASLKDATNDLSPSTFANPRHPELLDAVKKGLEGFVGEMGKVYVNGYDGEEIGELVETRKINAGGKSENLLVLSKYGEKCAKVCLTTFPMMLSALNILKKHCNKTCKDVKINKLTDLGTFFAGKGYDISESGKQNGELQNKETMQGQHIYERLVGNDYTYVYRDDKDTKFALENLNDYLSCYYQVTHISTFGATKYPCNVYEMLIWLAGLPCNVVYDELLRDAVSDLFEDPSKQSTYGEITVSDIAGETLAAYPHSINYSDTRKAVIRLCSTSYDILSTIAGTGDAHTVYGIDYCNNSFNFKYPSSAEDCLGTLLDILRRVLPPLRFLYNQCMASSKYYGWRECHYGKNIATVNKPCTRHSSDHSKCQPRCESKCEPECQPTSPLMCYLYDSLPGYMPHQLSAIGCKPLCKTCPTSKPGMPCLTPLGFRGFSGSTKTGEDICEILGTFFCNMYLPSLLCLMPTPPSTLPDHFQFALSLASMLNQGLDGSAGDVKKAVEASIKKYSINLYNEPSDLTDALSAAYKNNKGHNHVNHPKATKADLSTLSAPASCIYAASDNLHCGPYLSSLFCDTYNYLAGKHSDVYITWATYLPWRLHDYLRSLLDSFCNISCKDWGCRRCMTGSKCSRGKHGIENCQCTSLVECRGVSSIFYSFGFTVGNAKMLLGTESKKYCHHFYKQVMNVLKSECFTDLFNKCDEYLFTIRQPFIWLNVALWLLSLFYLICVMVGRLDVLHIRSHLRIPSSHKITAQSLLAAAQVGRLAKISYLQP